MIIKLSPVNTDQSYSLVKSEDTLIIDGVVYDFTKLKDGSTIPSEAVGCKWILNSVERLGKELIVTLILPHGLDAPDSVRFPSDIQPFDGIVVTNGNAAPVREIWHYATIDWDKEITKEMKDDQSKQDAIRSVAYEVSELMRFAASKILVLQDIYDLDGSTSEQLDDLNIWKRYRISLSKIPLQVGYPYTVDWPIKPE